MYSQIKSNIRVNSRIRIDKTISLVRIDRFIYRDYIIIILYILIRDTRIRAFKEYLYLRSYRKLTTIIRQIK